MFDQQPVSLQKIDGIAVVWHKLLVHTQLFAIAQSRELRGNGLYNLHCTLTVNEKAGRIPGTTVA